MRANTLYCLVQHHRFTLLVKELLLDGLLDGAGGQPEACCLPDPIVGKVEDVLDFAFLNLVGSNLEADQVKDLLHLLLGGQRSASEDQRHK